MQTIFTRQSDSEAFAKKGYLRHPMLESGQLEQLRELYTKYFGGGTAGFFSSTFIQDVELKKLISRKLTAILLPAVQPLLKDHKVLGAQFLIKNPGKAAQMPYHQDWTVVDEERHRSLTMWVSLDDVSESNGAIKLVEGSHRFSDDLRGPANFDKLAAIQQELDGMAQTLVMQAGEAFIFDHALVHGSGPNQSEKPRVAVALGLTHRDAELCFYHSPQKAAFEKYGVPDDFFITFPNNGQAPQQAALLGTRPGNFNKVSVLEFLTSMSHTDPQQQASPVQPLFKDKAVQEKFDSQGYVKLPMLEEAQVKALKDYYLSLNHDHIGQYGFHISLENKSQAYIDGVFKKLFTTVMPELDPLLQDYKAFTASYVIKEAGLQNIVPPHQDWTFVDESRYCSATVWIALMDVNKNNGALSLIKGSHRLFNYPRTSPSPQAKSLLSDHAFTLFPYVDVIEMKAGEALIFDNRTIHASPPNISGETRIAAGIGITQKDAQLLHYYQLPGPEQMIEVYEVDETFFPRYNNKALGRLYDKGERPTELKRISAFRKSAPDIGRDEMTRLVSSLPGITVNTALMAELATLYNYNADGTPKTKKAEEPAAGSVHEPVISAPAAQAAPADTRSFFQKYTPANILAEIKYRLGRN